MHLRHGETPQVLFQEILPDKQKAKVSKRTQS